MVYIYIQLYTPYSIVFYRIYRIYSILSYLSICLSVYLSIYLPSNIWWKPITQHLGQSFHRKTVDIRNCQSSHPTGATHGLPSMGKIYENVAPWNPYHRRNPWNQRKMGKLEWGAHQVTRKESSDSASRLSRWWLLQQIATVLYINGVLMDDWWILMDDWWILMATQWLYASVLFSIWWPMYANGHSENFKLGQYAGQSSFISKLKKTWRYGQQWLVVAGICWLVISIRPNKYDQLLIVQYHFVIPLCWYWLVNKQFHTIPWFPYWIIVIPKYIE